MRGMNPIIVMVLTLGLRTMNNHQAAALSHLIMELGKNKNTRNKIQSVTDEYVPSVHSEKQLPDKNGSLSNDVTERLDRPRSGIGHS